MKKSLSIAAASAMLLGVSACGGGPGTGTPPDSEEGMASEPAGDDEGAATEGEEEEPGGDPAGGQAAMPDLSGEELEVAAVWTGTEEERFGMVLDAFEQATGATIQYTSTGNDIGRRLTPRVEGGSPPDVAMLPQPVRRTVVASRVSRVSRA